MPEQIDVYYEGWGQRWLWGRLLASTALTGRPMISFEYSEEAVQKGIELAAYALPLQGPRLRTGFPVHQMGLPGPVYDAMPDGWGMLLMDRLFKRRGLNAARIGPLERLAYLGGNAMGAMSFQPASPEASIRAEDVVLSELASEIQEVLRGEGGAFLQRLLQMGGSPQGARPKVLLYREPGTWRFSTAAANGLEAWLVKFPSRDEHPEVCALEAVYARCLRDCDIAVADTEFFELPGGLAAFATKRFDRHEGLRVPMQSLAAFTGADYRVPGALDYVNFLRATRLCTNDVRQKTLAFERVVFNVVFNNRDDHPKNFAYLMSATGEWQLAPAYDVTFCEGPGGYHQMDVMGEALDIEKHHLLRLGEQETELEQAQVCACIEKICGVAAQFSEFANAMFPGRIRPETLSEVQQRINENLSLLA